MAVVVARKHSWNLTPREAAALQRRLQSEVICEDRIGTVERVAGVDVGFEQSGRITRAAVAVLTFPGLELCEHALVREPTRFPYVPGLLSFREIPAILTALQQLRCSPDLVLCDAHGRAHPRRFGLASHLGLLLDLPSIGVAKSRLIGDHDPVPPQRGASVALRDRGETIGVVLRTRAATRPVYVSIGHRLSLDTCIDYVLACTPRFRLPETTRWADRLASDRDHRRRTLSSSIPTIKR